MTVPAGPRSKKAHAKGWRLRHEDARFALDAACSQQFAGRRPQNLQAYSVPYPTRACTLTGGKGELHRPLQAIPADVHSKGVGVLHLH